MQKIYKYIMYFIGILIVFITLIFVHLIFIKGIFDFPNSQLENIPDKIVRDVYQLNGGKAKKNLKKQDIMSFEIGDKIYVEYEEGIYVEGIVIAKSGDKIEVKDSNIYNDNKVVYTSPKLKGVSTYELVGTDIACHFEDSIYEECIEYVLNDYDNQLQVIPCYYDDKVKNPIVVYAENKK